MGFSKHTTFEELSGITYFVVTKKWDLIRFKEFALARKAPALFILKFQCVHKDSSSYGSRYAKHTCEIIDNNEDHVILKYHGITLYKLEYSFCQAETYRNTHGYFGKFLDAEGNSTRIKFADPRTDNLRFLKKLFFLLSKFETISNFEKYVIVDQRLEPSFKWRTEEDLNRADPDIDLKLEKLE